MKMCNNDPTSDPRVIEALEACHPDSDDVELSELRVNELVASHPRLGELHRRMQHADSRLRVALHDVPVPEGLEQRILAGLNKRQGGVRQAEVRRDGHRRWMVVSGAAVVAASILVVFWVNFPRAVPRDEAEVLAEVSQRFLSEVASQTATGRLVAESEPPGQFAISRAVARVPDIRWRELRNLLGHRAVAYDLPGLGSPLATLYVFDAASFEIARTRPPLQPTYSTGGLCASAWREGGRLYVLVARGDARDYRRLIYAPSGPLT